jgi:hypothetical protein
MAKYRCPICGATHKEPIGQCRLCGQDLSGNHIPDGHAPVAVPITRRGGLKGFVIIGLIVVIALAAGALALGLVHKNSTVQSAENLFIDNSNDGWTTQTDDQGHYSVALPGDRTRETVDFGPTNDGKLTIWTSKISSDTEIKVGYGSVTPGSGTGSSGTALTGAGAELFLKDFATSWASENNMDNTLYQAQETSIAGYPAYIARSVQPKVKVDGKDAFAEAAFVLKGDTIYVLWVNSIYKNAEQLDRLMSSFTPTA